MFYVTTSILIHNTDFVSAILKSDLNSDFKFTNLALPGKTYYNHSILS